MWREVHTAASVIEAPPQTYLPRSGPTGRRSSRGGALWCCLRSLGFPIPAVWRRRPGTGPRWRGRGHVITVFGEIEPRTSEKRNTVMSSTALGRSVLYTWAPPMSPCLLLAHACCRCCVRCSCSAVPHPRCSHCCPPPAGWGRGGHEAYLPVANQMQCIYWAQQNLKAHLRRSERASECVHGRCVVCISVSVSGTAYSRPSTPPPVSGCTGRVGKQ